MVMAIVNVLFDAMKVERHESLARAMKAQ